MRHIGLGIVGSLAFASMVVAQTPADETRAGVTKITLADAKAYAISHNFKISALRQAEASARAAAERSKAAYYPRLGVAGGMDGRSAADEEQIEPVGYLYGTMNLFNGFEDTNTVEVSRLEAERATLEIKREELLVANAVEQEFHKILHQKALRAIKEEALALNTTHKRLVARVRGAGMASKTDEMEFELKHAELESGLVSIDQGVEEARVALRKLLGEDIGAGIEPVGDLQHQKIKGALMDYVSKMQATTLAVQLAAMDRQIAEAQSRLWRSKWLPDIDLEVRAGYLPLDERVVADETQISVLLTAKLELFSGFDTRWEREEQLTKQAGAETALRAEIQTAISDLETAYRRLKTIERRVALEQGNEDMSRKYYRSVMDEYNRGIKNSADLSDAVDRLTEASERRVQYVFEFLTERLAMERLLGAAVDVEVVTTKGTH